MTTLETPVVNYLLTMPIYDGPITRYIVPSGAAVTSHSLPWVMPASEFTAIDPAPQPIDRVRAKYRKVLASLIPQATIGDPGVLLIELAANEPDISEAETLLK